MACLADVAVAAWLQAANDPSPINYNYGILKKQFSTLSAQWAQVARGTPPEASQTGCFDFLYRAARSFGHFLERDIPPKLLIHPCGQQGRRARPLVFGPVCALTLLGTISADAAALATSPADQEARHGDQPLVQRKTITPRGEIASYLTAVGTDSTPQPWPVLP